VVIAHQAAPSSPSGSEGVQNQRSAGKLANRWDRTETVVEDKSHDKYVVKVNGSGRLNERHLWEVEGRKNHVFKKLSNN
jgi:hypothetical protein